LTAPLARRREIVQQWRPYDGACTKQDLAPLGARSIFGAEPMADDPSFNDLLRSIREARESILRSDGERTRLIGEIQKAIKGGAIGEQVDTLDRVVQDIAGRMSAVQSACDQLTVKMGRPSGGFDFSPSSEEAAARGLVQLRHLQRVPKSDPMVPPFEPTSEQMSEAVLAVKGIRGLLHTTSIDQLPFDQRKALSSFNMGASGFILPTEMSDRILSCITDPSDLAGVMGNISISGPAVRFLVDNSNLDLAQWASDCDCFAPGAHACGSVHVAGPDHAEVGRSDAVARQRQQRRQLPDESEHVRPHAHDERRARSSDHDRDAHR
jgi:hypothetical protein